MHEKLRIFPFGQYVVRNVVFLAFWWRSQVQNRNRGCEEMYKNVNTVSDGFFRTHQWRHSTPSLSMTSLSLAGVYCASTLLGRCLCKRVDVYIITLSCTWRIYALSECLLVITCHTCVWHCECNTGGATTTLLSPVTPDTGAVYEGVELLHVDWVQELPEDLDVCIAQRDFEAAVDLIQKSILTFSLHVAEFKYVSK